MPDQKKVIKRSECTKVNCPMQAGTKTDNCGENCPWRTTAKIGDLISRAALLKDLSYCAPELWQDEEYIKAKIMKQHAVDAVPVIYARPIRINPLDPGAKMCTWKCSSLCSACGEYVAASWKYCPNCGAKMDEEVKWDA